MTQTFYVVVDIETDGPEPGTHAMRNLSAVATDDAGFEVSSLSLNLIPPDHTLPDQGTLEWWQTEQSEIWEQITADPISAKTGMERFERFVRDLDGRRLFVGHPLAFDGHWVSHYMEQYLGQGLMAFPGTDDPLFFGAGIDLPSFVSGALNIDYGLCRHGRYPPEVSTELPHTHHGLDDARGHADVLRKTIGILRHRG
ncbi:3'-5' exoribonuclease [Tateyamaria sp. ANG-S1]|uniref:3'-5' exoribonuclease domain-containing protein n=1 Tax=Tateyamaria sp. ANG-S1 TaxID=1577905 RepID=UPI00057D7F48|nr:3'-5' exoribonuclease [Tateyamaria sp. ANG-S1]KIC48071.1 hypothetical protein RA29_17930 [Tateyamaria sp. ANG-S1]